MQCNDYSSEITRQAQYSVPRCAVDAKRLSSRLTGLLEQVPNKVTRPLEMPNSELSPQSPTKILTNPPPERPRSLYGISDRPLHASPHALYYGNTRHCQICTRTYHQRWIFFLFPANLKAVSNIFVYYISEPFLCLQLAPPSCRVLSPPPSSCKTPPTSPGWQQTTPNQTNQLSFLSLPSFFSLTPLLLSRQPQLPHTPLAAFDPLAISSPIPIFVSPHWPAGPAKLLSSSQVDVDDLLRQHSLPLTPRRRPINLRFATWACQPTAPEPRSSQSHSRRILPYRLRPFRRQHRPCSLALNGPLFPVSSLFFSFLCERFSQPSVNRITRSCVYTTYTTRSTPPSAPPIFSLRGSVIFAD